MLASEDLVNQALNDINSIEVLEPDGGIMPLADGELYFFPFGVKTGERKYVFSIATSWTKMPSVRSFDVLGIYWGTSIFTITEFEATQRTMNAGFVNYNRNGTNTKETSLGIATSMNLINDASTYNLDLDIDGEFTSSGTYKINFAYLHSTTPINLSQSHSFTFSQSGLGGVAYYSSASLRNQFEVKSASYTITV